jgi:hypothetical protein
MRKEIPSKNTDNELEGEKGEEGHWKGQNGPIKCWKEANLFIYEDECGWSGQWPK